MEVKKKQQLCHIKPPMLFARNHLAMDNHHTCVASCFLHLQAFEELQQLLASKRMMVHGIDAVIVTPSLNMVGGASAFYKSINMSLCCTNFSCSKIVCAIVTM